MAVDVQKTLTFLHELSEAADAEYAESGSLLLANKLGSNRATQYYYTNVHKIKSLAPTVFAQNYPQLVAEANALREDYERQTQQETRVNALESKLDEALKLIGQLVEAMPAPEPEKPAKGSKAKTEPAEDEPEADKGE